MTIPGDLNLLEAHRWASERFGTLVCVDEAGRGPLAGPVVAAAVIFTPGIELLGLDDSKKLTEKRREKLFPEIQEKATAWAIGEATPEEIDQINILEATFLAVRRAIDQLGVEWDHLLMDGSLPVRGIPLERQYAVIKGDALVQGIAAASILAKVHRDRLMVRFAQEYPEYGFEKHKGYPSPSHLEAILEFGRTPIHRHTFRVRGLEI